MEEINNVAIASFSKRELYSTLLCLIVRRVTLESFGKKNPNNQRAFYNDQNSWKVVITTSKSNTYYILNLPTVIVHRTGNCLALRESILAYLLLSLSSIPESISVEADNARPSFARWTTANLIIVLYSFLCWNKNEFQFVLYKTNIRYIDEQIQLMHCLRYYFNQF